ncbi:MAG: 4-carboxymuconolactone decarboxylase [Alphaproteobacteria bacterium]|nr:4-carboxymuconolactone decarboxylase [Alphaproteobacteria bacterium]
MDRETHDKGMAMRRQVLGDAYVDRALEGVDDFTRDFQRLVTQYGWGETWADPTLTPRERSILNLGMIAALGKMQEFETHTRGALRNGLTPDEIRAVLTQITAYCGMPVGVDCFRVARNVINEAKNLSPPVTRAGARCCLRQGRAPSQLIVRYQEVAYYLGRRS